MAGVALPYFDLLLGATERGADNDWLKSNVHWGLFLDDDDPSATAFSVAADRLTTRMLEMLELHDGVSVIDAGCGFGGALARMDQMVRGANLIGLNIDRRQLEAAVQFRGTENEITLVEGDACAVPVADDSADRVLALESVFHFPSRKAFMFEAARLLRVGGRLVLSDFVADRGRLAELSEWAATTPEYLSFFAPTDEIVTSVMYARWARAVGFRLLVDEDVTARTLPTYRVLRDLLQDQDPDVTASVCWLEEASRRGLLQYRLMSWERVR